MTQKKLSLNDSILVVPGIGPSTYLNFEKRNVKTINDLLHFFPIGYDDYSVIKNINSMDSSEKCTILGTLSSIQTIYAKNRRLTIQKGVLTDSAGSIGVVWFNQPFLLNALKRGQQYYISGKIDYFNGRIVLKAESFELHSPNPLHTARIVPRYSNVSGISDRLIRSKIEFLMNAVHLEEIIDPLPEFIRTQERLPSLASVIKLIHQPPSLAELQRAQLRTQFDELLNLAIQQKLIKKRVSLLKGHLLNVSMDDIERFKKESFPFSFTTAQDSAMNEIVNDLSRQTPMNRLLLGDVGSGKTAVFALATYVAVINKKKTIILAPTEVLVSQHYETLSKIFSHTPFSIVTVTNKSKGEIPKTADIVITTHAILYKERLPDNIGLLVIDEQHKFGVEQRFELVRKTTIKNITPHLLTVSATPIPRSLALIIHGSLDLSLIDELPKNRVPIITKLVPGERRAIAYQWLEGQMKKNKMQIFVVCPLIEDSENDRTAELRSVSSVVDELKKTFPVRKIDFLHSRIKNQQEIINGFKNHTLDILVSTTIVEVGVDIPNARCMIIEDADRFGLAQLHQLRGRVGRGDAQSFCFLFTKNKSEIVQKRLEAMVEIQSGFKLAELDLELRGPGSILGTAQHGFTNALLPHLFTPDRIKRIGEIADLLLAKNDDNSYTSPGQLFLN